MGIGTYPSSGDNYLGMIGTNGNYLANSALNQCDLLIAFGCSFSDRSTCKNPDFFDKCNIVSINIKPINKDFELNICASVKNFLKAFIESQNILGLKRNWFEQIKILKSEDDELYFFFHSKGTTNFMDSTKSIDSVFVWICGIYYYSLHEDYNAVEILEGSNRTMCGPFLLTPPENGTGNFLQFYAGGGYWINNASLKNLRKTNVIPELTVNNRYFAEKYPGMVLSTYDDYGLESINKMMVILGRVDGTSFYNGSVEDWNHIINLYPYPEKFVSFVNYIGNKVGFIPFNE